MGKKDRYNLDGAEDTLGENEQQSSSPDAQKTHEEGEEATNETTVAETANIDSSLENTSMEDTETDPNTDASIPANQNKIPHRVRYDSPKENRVSKAFFLDSEQDLPRIRELHTLADTEFDEKVHQIDIYLAAFRSDLNDESFLEEMRQIGYGYFE